MIKKMIDGRWHFVEGEGRKKIDEQIVLVHKYYIHIVSTIASDVDSIITIETGRPSNDTIG